MLSPRRWAASVVAVSMALAGVVASTGSAQAATSFHIDSAAGCRQFVDAVGANLGSVRGTTCNVASKFGEVRLQAGDSVTISPGWELFVDAVVFVNEGAITNRGLFRSTDDVVNNVGTATFVNYGSVTVERGSQLGFSDDSVFVNRASGRVNLDSGAMNVVVTAYNQGLIDVVAGLTVTGVLHNTGLIRVACDSRVSGVVTGNQPVAVACDDAPTVSSSRPVDHALNVPVDANLTLTFSEPVLPTRNWYVILCPFGGIHEPDLVSARLVDARASRVGPRTFRLDPKPFFYAGESCSALVYPGLVFDLDAVDPPDTMSDYFSFSFTTEVPASVVRRMLWMVRDAREHGRLSGPVAEHLSSHLRESLRAFTDDDPDTDGCGPLDALSIELLAASGLPTSDPLAQRLLRFADTVTSGPACA